MNTLHCHTPCSSPVGNIVRVILILYLSALTSYTSLARQPLPQTSLPTVTLNAATYSINVQVASTPRQRQTGLMWRQNMPENEGMLFVFETPSEQCFWMQNTLIPLSAAFIADDGTIVNIAHMQPLTTDSHCSAQPVRYVLEMNQGWFEKYHIEAGQRIQGGPFQLPNTLPK